MAQGPDLKTLRGAEQKLGSWMLNHLSHQRTPKGLFFYYKFFALTLKSSYMAILTHGWNSGEEEVHHFSGIT